MPDTRAVFFWMGGVITQALEPLLTQVRAVAEPFHRQARRR